MEAVKNKVCPIGTTPEKSNTKISPDRILELVIEGMKKHHLCDNYIIDGNNEDAILQLFYYFRKDERFTGSLHKGILLCGGVGSGKSILMKLFSLPKNNEQGEFEIISTPEIEIEFGRTGYEAINKYTYNRHMDESYAPPCEMNHSSNLCLDDLGIEAAEQKYYGHSTNPVADILLLRYNLFTEVFSCDNCLTHATSNLNLEMLSERFGDRLASRFKEMFNYIVLKGGDRRK